jgi:hypothetical protein
MSFVGPTISPIELHLMVILPILMAIIINLIVSPNYGLLCEKLYHVYFENAYMFSVDPSTGYREVWR